MLAAVYTANSIPRWSTGRTLLVGTSWSPHKVWRFSEKTKIYEFHKFKAMALSLSAGKKKALNGLPFRRPKFGPSFEPQTTGLIVWGLGSLNGEGKKERWRESNCQSLLSRHFLFRTEFKVIKIMKRNRHSRYWLIPPARLKRRDWNGKTEIDGGRRWQAVAPGGKLIRQIRGI